jgi:predicted nucleotidyltransferase component of viral defense system
MDDRSALAQIERFHLVLLRLLEGRLERASWVVKGGVNLRAWFGSRRYSEDLDIDLVRGARHVVEERVDKLLASRPFRDLLATQGLILSRTTKPKQTETTQRWKFEIRPERASVPLHTRVEFSRRGSRDEYVLEPVRADIVRRYGVPAPMVNHYTAASAIRQKIHALGSRAETQARDVWDLDHLLRTTGADPRPLSPPAQRALPEAIDRALALPFEVFKAQVVPFLAPDDQEIYGTADAWARMCELVAARLAELDE